MSAPGRSRLRAGSLIAALAIGIGRQRRLEHHNCLRRTPITMSMQAQRCKHVTMPRAGRVPQDSLHGLPEEPPSQRKAQRPRHHAFKNCRVSLLTTVIVAPRVSPAALSRAVPAALACFSTAVNAKASSFGRNHFRALSWHEDFCESPLVALAVITEFWRNSLKKLCVTHLSSAARRARQAREERRALRPPLSPCPRSR